MYTITLDVAGADPPCPEASATINVGAPGALTDFLRLRVVPPLDAGGPPFEKLIPVKGGAPADLGILTIDPGVAITARVIGPAGGVPAYLRFLPSGTPDAFVEGFSNELGDATVRLVAGTYSVLVVPSSEAVGPHASLSSRSNWEGVLT